MPIRFRDRQSIEVLREAFAAAGFSVETLSRVMRWDSIMPNLSVQAPALLDALQGNARLSALLKLFVFEYPVLLQEASDAVQPASLEGLLEAGLLVRAGAGIEATVRILPMDDLLIVSDRRYSGAELPRDLVMGGGLSSSILMRGTIRRHSRRTLDLCAGSGIQAIAAAPHSDRVVALEKNAHAIELGHFAAALNGRGNIEFRDSDFYSGAEGERFDLIVSNPPFVISPESELTFRDGGLGADRVSEHVVRNGPRLLNEGGYLQMICDWANYKGRDWQDHLKAWAEGSGCDMLVVCGRQIPARDYPGVWLSMIGGQQPLDYLKKARKWLDYYREQNIESMRFGFITLRKRSGDSNWFHALDAPLDELCVTGGFIERMFAAQDFLRANDSDAMLLQQHLALDEAVRFDQRFMPGDNTWDVKESALMLVNSGLPPVKTDRYIAGLCVHLNGSRPSGEVLAEMAAQMNTDFETLAPRVTPILRGLIELGYIGWRAPSNS